MITMSSSRTNNYVQDPPVGCQDVSADRHESALDASQIWEASVGVGKSPCSIVEPLQVMRRCDESVSRTNNKAC